MFTDNFSVNIERVIADNGDLDCSAQADERTLREIIDCSKLNISHELKFKTVRNRAIVRVVQ